MDSHLITLPTSLLVGRVSHAGGREGRSLHLICDRPLGAGKLERASGDPLCGRASRFPYLATYRQRVICVADICPRCLTLAGTHHFITADVIRVSQEAYARLRVIPGTPPPPSPWIRLPNWASLSEDKLALRSRGVSGLAIIARMSCGHPLPWSATMTEAWFKHQVAQTDATYLHRCPLVLRLPAPERYSERIAVLVDSRGATQLYGTPVARLGGDIVVSLSRFEIALQLHRPASYLASGEAYRKDLARWHRYPLTERARTERWQWRREHAMCLLGMGSSLSLIAEWFFETPEYLNSLVAQDSTVQMGRKS